MEVGKGWLGHRLLLDLQFTSSFLEVVHHFRRSVGSFISQINGFERVLIVHHDFVEDRLRLFERGLGVGGLLVTMNSLSDRDLFVYEVALAQELLLVWLFPSHPVELTFHVQVLRAPSL